MEAVHKAPLVQREHDDSVRVGEFCWIAHRNLNSKVGEKFLLLPNQRKLLNDNMSDAFLKNVAFF